MTLRSTFFACILGPWVFFSRFRLRLRELLRFNGNWARSVVSLCVPLLMLLCGILSVGYICFLIRLPRQPISLDSASFPKQLWRVPASFFARKTGLRHHPSLSSCTASSPCHFAIVADLDQNSLVNTTFPLNFRSYLLGGRLFWDTNRRIYTVHWAKEPIEIRGKYNEGGRGMEMSELLFFDQKLLCFDDRTGLVFEYLRSGNLAPRSIITETKVADKGMKIEWATVKEDTLWVGSFGKEYTNPSGNITSENNFEIALINLYGTVKHLNWKPIYTKLREHVGLQHPGYMIHEAVMWSRHLAKWIFLPRRASKEPYDEISDETRGSNMILTAAEDFSTIQVHYVKSDLILERGFSSFKFIPGTADRVILALKSVENSTANTQESYITIFETLTGTVLLPDTKVPYPAKFEGVEFIPSQLRFPFTDDQD